MNVAIKCLAAVAVAAPCVFSQITPASASSEPGSSKESTDPINWVDRVITVVGIGAPNPNQPQGAQRAGAIRAAQMVALRNALEIIKGISINSSSTVENLMSSNDVVSSRIDGFVKGFKQKGRNRYMSDGSVEITMEIPLDGIGGLGAKLYGDQLGENPSVTSFEGDMAKEKKVFTGLIVDCRGLKVKPALSPRIVDEAGKEIYGSAYVSREWAIKYGMAGYAKDMAAAMKVERAGKTPGKIKAMKAAGQNGTDIMVSNTDASEIRSAAENLKFLSECRIVFVID